jgi:hypothetical protein
MTLSCPHCSTLISIGRDVPRLPEALLFDCPFCLVQIIAARGDDGLVRRGVFVADGQERAVA